MFYDILGKTHFQLLHTWSWKFVIRPEEVSFVLGEWLHKLVMCTRCHLSLRGLGRTLACDTLSRSEDSVQFLL